MLQKIIDWLTSLWAKADPYAEAMVWDDTEYLRTRYGIAQPFADEDEEDEWTR